MPRCLVDVDAACPPMLGHRVLFHQIVRHRIEVKERITDRFLAADAQPAQIDLLYQVRSVGGWANPRAKERLQLRSAFAEESLD
jgi:hypothetical protein